MVDDKFLLVLGIGNTLLTDEGIGVHAVNTLRGEQWPDGVHFVDGGTFTQDLFHLFLGYQHLLVLDVVKGGRAPGTLYRLSEEDLVQDESQRLSLHDIDLLDSLRMAEMLGTRPRLQVIGVEPLDFTTWSMELTPELSAVLPKFLELARREIRAILDAPRTTTEGGA